MNDPTSSPDRPPALSRRHFLVGLAAAGALSACGSSESDGAGSDAVIPDPEKNATVTTPQSGFTLVQRFPSDVLVPGVVRLPITLSTGAAQFISDGPDTLEAHVVDLDGVQIGEAVTATRRDVVPASYYAFAPTVTEPGFYGLVVDGGPADGAAFQVTEAAAVPIPLVGSPLPGIDTPTVDDPQGLSKLCTLTPEPCPFHTKTVTEALAAGKPVAYLIGTPAFCVTGTCAPALESLIAAQERFGDAFEYVHAEVFSDDAGTEITPAVIAYGMTFEPTIFITDADGVIQDRLDAVWNQDELEEALARVAG